MPSILVKKCFGPISCNISKGPFDQLKPNLKASSISLNSFVISGTRDDEYFMILDITDHANFPYLSFRFINFLL